MTTIEDRLTEHLAASAAAVTLRFSADDVRRPPIALAAVPAAARRRTRPVLVAAIALAIAGAGALALWIVDDRPVDTRAAVGAGEASTRGIDERITELDNAGSLVGLARSEGEPRQLAPDAVVLDADGVGRIEVGAPSATMIDDAPELEDAHCVATASSHACALADGRGQSGRTVAEAGAGYVAVAGSASGSPMLMIDGGPAPVLVVTSLPADTALVEIDTPGGVVAQVPLERTIALPGAVDDDGWGAVRALGGDGLLTWRSAPGFLDPPTTTDAEARTG